MEDEDDFEKHEDGLYGRRPHCKMTYNLSMLTQP
jgi:hypothetical protein